MGILDLHRFTFSVVNRRSLAILTNISPTPFKGGTIPRRESDLFE
jgi:hypothetical protein